MKAKFKIGDKVCMKDDVAHIALPEFYPDCTVNGILFCCVWLHGLSFLCANCEVKLYVCYFYA